MPTFSPTSVARLATCDPRLQEVMNEAIKHTDFTVLEGHRGKEAQTEAVMNGTSKLMWPLGKHNKTPALAVDIAPFPLDWKDTHRFAFLMGQVARIAAEKGVKIRFGMDWNRNGTIMDEKFRDMPHVEIDD